MLIAMCNNILAKYHQSASCEELKPYSLIVLRKICIFFAMIFLNTVILL